MPRRWAEAGHATAADFAACAALLRSGSLSFHAASRVLPSDIRRGAMALYAFCRLADDAVDDGDAGLAALERLSERLARAYEGRPLPDPVDRAFADTVAHFEVPRALPEALLEGFEWDLNGRRYETFTELAAYASRVAGTVGAMMTVLMGVRSREALARACDLGVAMQFTNIARDVGEDARNGRLYLPLAWLREAGIEPDAWLARPQFTPGLGGVVRRLLDDAEVLYRRSAGGIAALPWSCRPGIHAARLLYAAIGREVERNGLDSVSRRAVVPPARKLVLVGAALVAALAPASAASAPALDETRFLVEASARLPHPEDAAVARRTLDDRVAWLVDLFERLDARDQQRLRASLPAGRQA